MYGNSSAYNVRVLVLRVPVLKLKCYIYRPKKLLVITGSSYCTTRSNAWLGSVPHHNVRTTGVKMLHVPFKHTAVDHEHD